MIVQFKDTDLIKLVYNICKEHYAICNITDTNLGYLWYMYYKGKYKGYFKPFIFLAEVNLLVKLNYLTEDEKRNIIQLMISQDQDNMIMAGFSILTLRNQRIKELGEYTQDNKLYENINYSVDIIKLEDFMVPLAQDIKM
tara:strand:+ start:2682 stop:3101 length:420 start_codon:yes stop_codon:yes gene_type:complete